MQDNVFTQSFVHDLRKKQEVYRRKNKVLVRTLIEHECKRIGISGEITDDIMKLVEVREGIVTGLDKAVQRLSNK